ncbi:MAG: hypothetical protein KKB59_14115 [Spirochaetes bacterium]|nr:hypothetical protein [Spirochaetota bacterium]
MPILPTVDYSPQANAIRGLGAAGQANFSEEFERIKAKEETRQEVYGTIVGAFEVASSVYGILEQSKMEKGKQDAIRFQSDYRTAVQESILNGSSAVIEEDGRQILKLDPSLQTLYDSETERISKEYGGFGRVQNWLKTQATQSQAESSAWANNVLLDQGMKEAQDAFNQNVDMAMKSSIGSEDITPVYDVIQSTSLLTPKGKEALFSKAQRSYGIGVAENRAIASTREGGLSAGLADIDATSFSEDEKASLRASVANTVKAETAAASDAAVQAYDEAKKGERFVADTAIKDIAKQYPEWMRPAVESQLRTMQSTENWEREIKRYDTVGRWNMGDIEAQIADVRSKDNQYFRGDEETRKKVLDLLQTRMAAAESGSSGASDKFGENYVSGVMAKFYKKEINHPEAVRLLTGVMDIAPNKAGPAIEEVVKYESPEYASAFKDVTTFITGLKLAPEERALLTSVVRDSLYQTMIDNPNMKNTDFVQAGKQLVNVVAGKGMDLLRKNLIIPGWFASTDDQLGSLQKTLDASPELSAALVYTDQQGNIGMNTYTRASIAQLHDRQRAIVSEALRVPIESVVQTYESEGPWDITAQARFSVKGSEKPFYFKAPEGKLELWQGNVKLAWPPVKKKGEIAPVSDDFWTASEFPAP